MTARFWPRALSPPATSLLARRSPKRWWASKPGPRTAATVWITSSARPCRSTRTPATSSSPQSGNPGSHPRAYRFHHRFGLPVRYHDIESFAANSNLDLVEIHLSYKDLEVNLDQVLPTQQPIGLVVHAPELFAGDHTSICSADNDYRRHSIEELQRVVDISRDLRQRFDCPEPVLVTNVGGFSEHHLERPELQPL